jgi:hypothetical protein
VTARVLTCALLGAAALFGAVLGVPRPAFSHKPITTNILFKNEIAQIFQRKCFQCHSDNNLSMSLTTYTDARPWARAIREEVLERKMPPWQAVPGYGHFANDISLNTREMEIILSWTDGGAPSGVLKVEESVPPVYVAPAPLWDHGPPDQILRVGKGHTVASGSPFALKRFVVATNLAAPKRVRAIALKQGDRRVVRHAAFYDEATGRWLGAWTPWQTAATLPDGMAVRLAAKARLIVEIGYSGTEEDVSDASEVGLYFAADTGTSVGALVINAPSVSVPAGTTSQRLRTETKIGTAIDAVALWPNPTPGARSIEISVVSPDEVVTPLLWIKEYRPEWRAPYFLSAPVTLPRGSRLVMTTYFENPGESAVSARAQAWLLTAPVRNEERRTKN